MNTHTEDNGILFLNTLSKHNGCPCPPPPPAPSASYASAIVFLDAI